MARTTPRAGRGEEAETSPGRFPEVTPDYTTHQSSFVLQAIMELQKSVGGLVATVESLRTDVKGQGEKIDNCACGLLKSSGARL
jgi:hypothetical protein